MSTPKKRMQRVKKGLLDRALVELSNSGGDRLSGPPSRWYLHSETFTDRYFRIRLYEPGPVAEWPSVEYTEHMECSIEHPEVTEDFPYTWPPQPQVVSNAMKLFFEEHAPGDGQFLPITIRQQRGRFFEQGEYWCVHWVKVIDCIDWARSRWKKQRNDQGLEWFEFGFMGAIFDPSKVPHDVQVFRPHGIPAHCVLVKSEFAKKLRKARFSGTHYSYVSLATDPDETLSKVAQPFAAFMNLDELGAR